MIRIKFGISKRRLKKIKKIAYQLGHAHGTKAGEQYVINNIRKRVELLNPEYPVSVTELRKWVGLDD